MNQFTIRDIENLCGIKAHTLRAWEQRYRLFVPKRKESQHRIYDDNDLKELLRISFLYHNGYKVSKLAAMSMEEKQNAVTSTIIKDDNYELFVHQMIEASIDFNKEALDKIINSLTLRIGMEKAIIHVFYPFLKRIGLLWLTNNVIPAQEHFASHIIRKKIIMATDGLEVSPGKGPVTLVFAPKGELHELPLLAANYFFRKENNFTVYLGVDVNYETLCYYLDRKPVDFLFAHIITHLDDEELDKYLCRLSKDYPDKKILLSGPATSCIKKLPLNLIILHTIDEMLRFTKETAKTT
jgi:MerR family transcriptional regulator, light-induced transcriptional regulator